MSAIKHSENFLNYVKKERFRLKRIRKNLEMRNQAIFSIRNYFQKSGFMETDTPQLVPAPAPEANIETIAAETGYLIASPELQMKRLIMAGYEKIFQIVHCFRYKERSNKHLQEFTMLEWYRANESIQTIMNDCKKLILKVIKDCKQFVDISHLHYLDSNWEVYNVRNLYIKYAGWDPIIVGNSQQFDFDMVDKIEPNLPKNKAVFLYGYPSYQASLARVSDEHDGEAERFELYIDGMEIANGFDELTNAEEQRMRFKKEKKARILKKMNDYPLDELFLNDLSMGMPQTVGIALGIDRLLMVLTRSNIIDDVVYFTDKNLLIE